jgi:hypothetical protein
MPTLLADVRAAIVGSSTDLRSLSFDALLLGRRRRYETLTVEELKALARYNRWMKEKLYGVAADQSPNPLGMSVRDLR